MQILLQLLISAVLVLKQPESVCNGMNMAVFQLNVLYENGISQIWLHRASVC